MASVDTTSPATGMAPAPAKTVTLSGSANRKLPLGTQLVLQAICLFIAFTVLFPIAWVVGMSLNPSNVAHPKDIFPTNPTLDAY